MSDDTIGAVDPRRLVAIVDDAIGEPTREAVAAELEAFCAGVEECDEGGTIAEVLGCEVLDASSIDDEVVARLYAVRTTTLASFGHLLDGLFLGFDQRRQDLQAICEGVRKAGPFDVKEFAGLSAFRDATTRFDAVLLDYHLADEGESAGVAREVYDRHQAFIILMSDDSNAGSIQEDFRRREGLLRGFFRFVLKEELLPEGAIGRAMSFVPEDRAVCHAVHRLVDALDGVLVGDVPESGATECCGGDAVVRFMETVRALPLSDYALLCELTLADEGHPLGDYVRRLFGAYLVREVFGATIVSAALRELDGMRFTEFLPLAGPPSDSLRELYTASLVEPVVSEWGTHPWEDERLPARGDEN